MSDIFEIKSKKIELRIGSHIFEIRDPKFAQKIILQKEYAEIEKKKDSLEQSEYLEKSFELLKRSIKLFIPDMPDSVLEDEIPESSLPLLMRKINELAEDNFGTSIEKSEKASKK